MLPSDRQLSELQPAPGRGQYDRRQPREARLLEQRARLLSATALALMSDREATIASVVKRAGVSRNTFYEYFDDFAHAQEAARQRAEQRLVAALRTAEERSRTPVDRWRALTQGFLAWVAAAPADALLCLESGRAGLGSAGHELEAAFTRSLELLRASGVATPMHDKLRVTAVAAAAEVLARQIVAALAGAADANGLAAERESVERALVDVAVRLLR